MENKNKMLDGCEMRNTNIGRM